MSAYTLDEFPLELLNPKKRGDIPELALAAELGKRLLERNEELENTLREYEDKLYYQEEKIRNISREAQAQHDVNNTRLKIYEQLESNIGDLERVNHELEVDNVNERQQVRHLKNFLHKYEEKCAELEETIYGLKLQLEMCKKRTIIEKNAQAADRRDTHIIPFMHKEDEEPATKENVQESQDLQLQIEDLVYELEMCKMELTTEKNKSGMLENELLITAKKNLDLEDQLIIGNNSSELSDIEQVSLKSICNCKDVSLYDEIEEDFESTFYEGVGDLAQTSTPPKYINLIKKYHSMYDIQRDELENVHQDVGIQTDCIALQMDDVEVLYKNKAIDINNNPKLKQFFLALRDEIEKVFIVESNAAGEAVRPDHTTAANVDRGSSSVAKPGLAEKQNKNIVNNNNRRNKHNKCNQNKQINAQADLNESTQNPSIPKVTETPLSQHPPLSTVVRVEPELIPLVREEFVEHICNVKGKRKKKSRPQEEKPVLVGVSTTNSRKWNVMPIAFHYPEYRKSVAMQNLQMLKKVDSKYAEILKQR